jgi:C1A family cysteine protease
MALNSKELKKLQEELLANNATWEAGPTSINKLSTAQRRLRLGCIPEQKEKTESAEKLNVSFPEETDLTNREGANYVDPVQDQGSCGSCVGFAVTATLETTLRLKTQLPYNDRAGYALPQLSAADVFFCGSGGDCARGTQIAQP